MKAITGILVGAAAVATMFVVAGAVKKQEPTRKSPPPLVGVVEGAFADLVRRLQEEGYTHQTWDQSVPTAVSGDRLREFAMQMSDAAASMDIRPGRAIAGHLPEDQRIIGIVSRRAGVEPRWSGDTAGLAVDTWWKK